MPFRSWRLEGRVGVSVAIPEDDDPTGGGIAWFPHRRPAFPRALPAPPTVLVGREREIAAVAALLERPDVRIVTLAGPGGVGKTRLALATAASVAERLADGAAFVDLAPVADPDLAAPAVARALGVRESNDEPLLDALLGFLRGREALLVLDNFEHLLDAAGLVSALLDAGPGLTVLVTSRALLRIEGEHAFPVAPLGLPDADAPPDRVAETEAVRLFAARARAAQPDFALGPENAAAVAAICRRLDGLPLAIELAAARIGVFPPRAMQRRLEERLLLPLAGPRGAPPRQRTLGDAIAWSHDLLDPAGRVLFRRLAPFVGGFTLDAAEWVAGEAAAPAWHRPVAAVGDVVGGVVGLVEQSLLRVVAEGDATGDAEPRYAMLETVREQARERLAASGEEDAIRRRHAAWCLALVEEAEPGLWAVAPGPALARIEAEFDNLRAALAWALERDAETALRLAGGLWQAWERGDRRAEAASWLDRALAHPDAATASPAARARAMTAAGTLAAFRDDHAQAEGLLARGVAAWREIGEPVELARALLHLGETVHRQGEPGRAEALWEEALGLFREPEDARSIAEIHNLLGFAAFDQGRFERAEAMFERAIALVRGKGDRAFEAQQLMNLGVVAGMRGDWPRAAAMCEEALAAFQGIGAKVGAGYALMNLGDCVIRLGDAGRALALFQESLALTLAIDNREGVLFALEGLAVAALAIGRPQQAARLLGAADAMRDELRLPPTPLDLADRAERLLAPLTGALGEGGLAAALAAGRLAPLDVVTADALALVPPAGKPPGPAPVIDLGVPLTRREREVLRLLVEGRTDKEIADALFISRATASKHVESLRGKLGVTSRAAVVAIAIRAGVA